MTTDNSNHSDQKWAPTTRETLVILMLAFISFFVALNSCMITTSLPAIIAGLDFTSVQGFWVGTSYLLSCAVSMQFISETSEIFGRAICLMFSLVSFTVGTVSCCLAQTITPMLVGRSLQGVGGAGIMSLSSLVLTDMVPLLYRPKWYGIILGTWAVGNCIGPLLGGVIAQSTTWRWVFYAVCPLCALSLVITPLLLTLKPPKASVKERLKNFDWLGSALLALSAVLFLTAISWGGVQFAWDTAATSVPLCLGSTGLIWTCVYEKKFAKNPLLRCNLFQGRSQLAIYTCGLIQGLVLYTQLYYIPIYFMSVKEYSPIQTGIATLPIMVISVPVSVITGALVTKTNGFRPSIWSGWTFLTAGCGLTLVFDMDTSKAVCVVTLVLIGLGHGAILNAQNSASQAMCKLGDESFAAGMYAFLRTFGYALGVGIGGSAFQNAMSLKLKHEGLPVHIAQDSEAFLSQLGQLPDNSFKRHLLTAYVAGFRGVSSLLVAFSGLALVLSLLIKGVSMTKTIPRGRAVERGTIVERLSHRVSQHQSTDSSIKAWQVGDSGTGTPSTPQSYQHDSLQDYCLSDGDLSVRRSGRPQWHLSN
ncbi:major facilitator superfamily transporter [Thelonectria olida]|uniref:Major facilitator superfamily transporter n=1 Tax=Thelonectria olida TaxID=1576542 RepID=A0A9P9AKX8_9HYPO|nr:major facilitator superfamily transporter [Thelonectria olida]